MQQPPPSPSIRLASLLLGEDLGTWVRAQRNDDRSWRYIAELLTEKTNGQVSLTSEWLRQLYGKNAA